MRLFMMMTLAALVTGGCATKDGSAAEASSSSKPKASPSTSASAAKKAPSAKPLSQLSQADLGVLLGKLGYTAKEAKPIETDEEVFTQPEFTSGDKTLYVAIRDFAKHDTPKSRGAYKIGKDWALTVAYTDAGAGDQAAAKKLLAALLAKGDPPTPKDIEAAAKAELKGFSEDGAPAVNTDDLCGNSDTSLSFMSDSPFAQVLIMFREYSGTTKGKGAAAGCRFLTGDTRTIHLTPLGEDEAAQKKMSEEAAKALTDNTLGG